MALKTFYKIYDAFISRDFPKKIGACTSSLKLSLIPYTLHPTNFNKLPK